MKNVTAKSRRRKEMLAKLRVFARQKTIIKKFNYQMAPQAW